jgi:predicted RNase H-like HicB family nuclease
MSVRAIVHRHKYGYWAEVPSLPGCVAFGPTEDEVLENIYQAVDDVVRAYRIARRPVPWQPVSRKIPEEGAVHELVPFWDEPPTVTE